MSSTTGREGGGLERVAGPLRLRRPRRGDIDAYVRLHTDPRTYAHAPQSMPDAIRCRVRLEDDLEDWRTHGVGYLAVEEIATGTVVGWGGVRRYPDHPTLNLYYRLGYPWLGRGWGRELARAIAVGATEELPEWVVRASITPANVASVRTAQAAGLVRIGTDENPNDPPGSPPSELFELARVTRVDHLDAGLRADVVRVWGEALADELADVVRAGKVVGALREPEGAVLGVGWRPGRDAQSELGSVVLVDPAAPDRNLAPLLVGGLSALTGHPSQGDA